MGINSGKGAKKDEELSGITNYYYYIYCQSVYSSVLVISFLVKCSCTRTNTNVLTSANNLIAQLTKA